MSFFFYPCIADQRVWKHIWKRRANLSKNDVSVPAPVTDTELLKAMHLLLRLKLSEFKGNHAALYTILKMPIYLSMKCTTLTLHITWSHVQNIPSSAGKHIKYHKNSVYKLSVYHLWCLYFNIYFSLKVSY